eukprot:2067099-Pyramimonas_sp.AAC.1
MASRGRRTIFARIRQAALAFTSEGTKWAPEKPDEKPRGRASTRGHQPRDRARAEPERGPAHARKG